MSMFGGWGEPITVNINNSNIENASGGSGNNSGGGTVAGWLNVVLGFVTAVKLTLNGILGNVYFEILNATNANHSFRILPSYDDTLKYYTSLSFLTTQTNDDNTNTVNYDARILAYGRLSSAVSGSGTLQFDSANCLFSANNSTFLGGVKTYAALQILPPSASTIKGGLLIDPQYSGYTNGTKISFNSDSTDGNLLIGPSAPVLGVYKGFHMDKSGNADFLSDANLSLNMASTSATLSTPNIIISKSIKSDNGVTLFEKFVDTDGLIKWKFSAPITFNNAVVFGSSGNITLPTSSAPTFTTLNVTGNSTLASVSATSISPGALTVSGTSSLATTNCSGVATFSNYTQSTNTSNGAVVISNGGLGITNGNVYVGGATNVGALTATGTSTLGTTNCSGVATFINYTQSTSNANGAVVITNGGLGVSGNLNMGGNLNVGGTTNVVDLTTTGSCTISNLSLVGNTKTAIYGLRNNVTLTPSGSANIDTTLLPKYGHLFNVFSDNYSTYWLHGYYWNLSGGGARVQIISSSGISISGSSATNVTLLNLTGSSIKVYYSFTQVY